MSRVAAYFLFNQEEKWNQWDVGLARSGTWLGTGGIESRLAGCQKGLLGGVCGMNRTGVTLRGHSLIP